MKIIRFTAPAEKGLGTDPLFGILEDDDSIKVLKGDPIYAGTNPVTNIEIDLRLPQVRLLAPVIPRSKVVCIGKNYADHAAEMDSQVPTSPIIFIKPNTSVIGPNDVINWPAMSNRIDHEAELAIVIGRICKSVPAEKINDVIFGYTIANDVTARDLQKVDGQWTRAKGFDGFCPLGPWIDTDFKPANQQITARVNGEIKQSDQLSNMVFKIPQIIQFVSEAMTLLPGDVILTGTPAGISAMPENASIEIEIEGLGVLKNKLSKKSSN
jgi:2-keto-4-pentenoate hydratase/2-oxohepta-3-ene-1,7-dioic acid hydratase in catechol pathway